MTQPVCPDLSGHLCRPAWPLALFLLLAGFPAWSAEPVDTLPAEEAVAGPEEQYMQLLPGDPQLFQEKFGTSDPAGHDGRLDETDYRYAANNWPLLPPDGSADEAYFTQAKENLANFIHDHREAAYYPGYHPILGWDRDGNAANGLQPLLAPDFGTARVKLILPKKGLRTDESDFLAANNITEGKDSDGRAVYKFGNTDAGYWYRFDNVKVTYYFQKKHSMPERSERVPAGTYPESAPPLTDEAELEGSGFLAKYLKLEAPINSAPASFSLTEPAQLSVKYSPPGKEAFDPGHTGLSKTDPKMIWQKCQTYVSIKATIMKAPATAGDPVPASAFGQAGNYARVAEQKVYVEDYWPPMPSTAAELASAVVRAPDPAGRPPSTADLDLPALAEGLPGGGQPGTEQPLLARHGFPDLSKGESLLGSMHFQNDNPADTRVNSVLSFELGRSMNHRFRYSSTGVKVGPGNDLSVLDRFIIYVPPYEMGDGGGGKVVVGPYAGQVWRAEDPFNTPEWKARYTPIAFSGPLLETVNHLFDHSGSEQGKIESEYGQTGAGNGSRGYPYSAIIDYVSGAETVLGIHASGLEPGSLPPGVIAIPAGFASYEGKVGEREYKAMPGAELLDQPAGTSRSLNGRPTDGSQARDSYFKFTASDCCSNVSVILAGTFSTIDNVRPNCGCELQEAQTAAGREERVSYVARIPNGTADGSNATVVEGYHPDSPHSRIDPQKTILQRGYGDYCNQVREWNSSAALGTPANPADSQGRSFLDLTIGGQKPPIIQNHRMMLTLCAEDDVSEAYFDGRIVYPISHLSYRMLRPDGGLDGEAVLISTDNNASSLPAAPCVEVPYIFHAEGEYQLVITARDLSGNERVTTLRVPVARETPVFQQIEQERQRGN